MSHATKSSAITSNTGPKLLKAMAFTPLIPLAPCLLEALIPWPLLLPYISGHLPTQYTGRSFSLPVRCMMQPSVSILGPPLPFGKHVLLIPRAL